MTGKKRGKKMKAVRRWALIFANSNMSQRTFFTRREARVYREDCGFASVRIARIEIREIPAARRK